MPEVNGIRKYAIALLKHTALATQKTRLRFLYKQGHLRFYKVENQVDKVLKSSIWFIGINYGCPGYPLDFRCVYSGIEGQSNREYEKEYYQ